MGYAVGMRTATLLLACLSLAACNKDAGTSPAVESRLLTRRDADDAFAAPASEVHGTEVLKRFGEPFARVHRPGASFDEWLYDIDDKPVDWVLVVEVQNDRVIGARRGD